VVAWREGKSESESPDLPCSNTPTPTRCATLTRCGRVVRSARPSKRGHHE